MPCRAGRGDDAGWQPARNTAVGPRLVRGHRRVDPAHRLARRRDRIDRLGGYTSAEIANLLGQSLRSIETSRARLRQALDLRTRAEIVRFF